LRRGSRGVEKMGFSALVLRFTIKAQV
jgi:hypothetical protein